MAGRKPKPTSLKLLDGNPGHRAINRNEPKFGGVPTCPKHLSKVAKAEWKRVSGELIAQGLLTTVDRAALAAYASCWSRWIVAEENIEKFGLVIKSPKSGYPIQNPYLGVANTALDQMRKFLIEFGMTPSARSRIHASGDGGSNPGDAFSEFMQTIGAGDIDVTTYDDSETQLLRQGD